MEGDRTYRGWGAGVCDRGGEADYERILWNRLGQFLMRAFAGDELSLAQLRQSAGCVRLRQIFRGAAHKRL